MNSHPRFRLDCTTLFTPRFAAPMLATAIASLAAPKASASPSYVSAFASVTRPFPFSGPLTQDTGQLVGQTATDAEVSFNASGQNSSAQVRAELGGLGVRVLASSAGFTSGATAVGIAKFADDLQITSATSPFGTPVTLQFSMELDGTTTFAGQPSATGLDSSLFLIGQVAGVSHTYHELYRSGHAVQVTGAKSFTVNSTVGATLSLLGTLDINARSDYQPSANSALSDYLNSAKFYVTANHSGVSVVGTSGHDYSAIPEPEQATMAVGAALACLGLWRTARRH